MTITTPISPEEVLDKVLATIPVFVIIIANKLIVENYNVTCKRSKFSITELARRIDEEATLRNIGFILSWLDIEPLYRGFGWKVHAERHSTEEDKDTYFVFTKNGQPKT